MTSALPAPAGGAARRATGIAGVRGRRGGGADRTGRQAQLALHLRAVALRAGDLVARGADQRLEGVLALLADELVQGHKCISGAGSALQREGEAPAEPSSAARQEPRPPEVSVAAAAVDLAGSQQDLLFAVGQVVLADQRHLLQDGVELGLEVLVDLVLGRGAGRGDNG